MKFDTVAALRGKLEAMETAQLDDMLLEELRRDAPDGNTIRLISGILKERDQEQMPWLNDQIHQAWAQYRGSIKPDRKKGKRVNSFLLKAASVLLVLAALAAAVPQKAEAWNIFERLIAWTEDVFSLTSPAEEAGREAYAFQTDNPDLQEVYDRVTELGITAPVVPSWIPEGYELVECKVSESPTTNCLYASFSNGGTELLYQMNSYADNVSYEFYKDAISTRIEEKNGIDHTIIQNEDVMVALWTVDNIQCSIFIDCQEETLLRILDAIYTMEVK